MTRKRKKYVPAATQYTRTKQRWVYELRIWEGLKPGTKDNVLCAIPFPVEMPLLAADAYAFDFAVALWGYLTVNVAVIKAERSAAELLELIPAEMVPELDAIRDSFEGMVYGQLVRLDKPFVLGQIRANFGLDPNSGDWDVVDAVASVQKVQKTLEAIA